MTAIAVVAVGLASAVATADDAAKGAANKVDTTPEKFGVLLNDPRALAGYNLINPGRKQTYLFDNEGRVVHTWTSEYSSGAAVYLLDNGHLFRPAEATNRKPGFQGPAASGRFQEFDWDGNLVWDFEYHSDKRMPHHDAIKLPNGNALLICWERIDEEEAVARGRRPETVKDSHLQPDCLVEIKPTGATTGEIVWEWRSWDHLIQDRDRNRPNYGKVSDHPERFDVNYIHGEEDQALPKSDAEKKDADKDAASKGSPNQPPAVRKNPDWMHVNAVAYNAELDQIALSSPHFHEIWIIDHGTTTEEARGHTGGRWGKGGDLLYRWGNPRAYRNGTGLDQRLFFQHNIQWIPKGVPGEGHLLVFNNGGGRKPDEYSSVDEFIPPTDEEGNYIHPKRGPFGPEKALWSYTAPNPTDFFSWFISGTQRLPNGNTLVNSGAVGVVFEVTPWNEVVWKFSNPFKRLPPPPPPATAPTKRFESLAGPLRDALGLTADQRQKLEAIDNELIAQLDGILSADEIKKFAEPNPSDDADFSKQPAGVYLTVFNRTTPELTEEKRQKLQGLQKEFSQKIAEVLNDAQKTLIADRKKRQLDAAAGRGAPRRQGNTLFRATRYALNHPAFSGRTLEPGRTLVEIEEEFDRQKPQADASVR
ncbi:MAG TPA: aryl-sulfate sulfotransferase [Pirellulales bacterium]|nr:aryl-sulfate sulfotransferase [Pirellulales bacterium]